MSREPEARVSERPVVLIVDDDDTTRLIMRRVLECAGLLVEEATDVRTAVVSLERTQPDLILLDMLMPGMNGVEGCGRLRQVPGMEQAPILVVSGIDDARLIEGALQAGATEFMSKPIRAATLRERVLELLGKPVDTPA